MKNNFDSLTMKINKKMTSSKGSIYAEVGNEGNNAEKDFSVKDIKILINRKVDKNDLANII